MTEIETTVMLVQMHVFQQDVEMDLLGLDLNSVMMEITTIMMAVSIVYLQFVGITIFMLESNSVMMETPIIEITALPTVQVLLVEME
jgi:uncharacterized protein YbcV (DUF1398 family)